MLHGQCKGCARTTWLNDNWYCNNCNKTDAKVDINKIVNKIIRLLKNDYLFDVDDEEEYAIKSDIYDILKEVIK